MKDIRLTIRAKNNILISLREQYGMTQIEMSKAIGINLLAYGCYENMSWSPINRQTGKLRPTAKLILDFFDMPFQAIWTEGILGIKERVFVTVMDSALCLDEVDQPLMIAGPEEELIKRDLEGDEGRLRNLLDKVLQTLTPREERVLREMYFEGKTLEQVGEDFDLTRERVRQIKERATEKLRHPSGKRFKIIKLIEDGFA